jgi:hypothetical protein
MKKFLFISRHTPTAEQHDLAADMMVELHHVGDADAFSVTQGWVDDQGAFEGVVVVHPNAALLLAPRFLIGVFENANRAPVGEAPQFLAVAFHIHDLRD